jgi:hypothetical protein
VGLTAQRASSVALCVISVVLCANITQRAILHREPQRLQATTGLLVGWGFPRSARNDGGAERQERDGGGGIALAALNAIPLGMERSVENHPCHQPRHSVGMPPKYLWAHSYGMCCARVHCPFLPSDSFLRNEKMQATCHTSLPDLTPDLSPKERGGLRRTSCPCSPLLWRGVGGEVSGSVVPAGLADGVSQFKIQNSQTPSR